MALYKFRIIIIIIIIIISQLHGSRTVIDNLISRHILGHAYNIQYQW